MNTYKVIVGVIGVVYEGDHPGEAAKYYDFFVMNSRGIFMYLKGKDPRAIGQSVQLLRDGKPIEEYMPGFPEVAP